MEPDPSDPVFPPSLLAKRPWFGTLEALLVLSAVILCAAIVYVKWGLPWEIARSQRKHVAERRQRDEEILRIDEEIRALQERK